MAEVDCVSNARTLLGEGPIWYQQVLYWIDIEAMRVFITSSDGNTKTIQLQERVGTVVPRDGGGLVIASASGFSFLDPETEHVTPICDPEPELPANRFNDGKCDAQGRFWAGSMNTDVSAEKYTGALYMLDRGGKVHKRLSGVGLSNGLCWNEDSSVMYYIDTLKRSIDAFDFDAEDGNITNRRVIASYAGDLCPDGMTIDSEGNIWTAIWGGHCVDCHDPRTGELLHKVEVPAQQVTACAFGGQYLETLYVTTASIGLTSEQLKNEPLSGGLFATIPGVTGTPSNPYKG